MLFPTVLALVGIAATLFIALTHASRLTFVWAVLMSVFYVVFYAVQAQLARRAFIRRRYVVEPPPKL